MSHPILCKASAHCNEKGYRLTEPRERVLKVLAQASKPLGAYEILRALSTKQNKPNPPTIYRAIQFWLQEGFIHNIDSLKSYVICCHGRHEGHSQFLVCSECGFTQELDNLIDLKPLKKEASFNGFVLNSCTVEIKGLCNKCHEIDRTSS